MKIELNKLLVIILLFCFIYVPPLVPHALLAWLLFFLVLFFFRFSSIRRYINKQLIAVIIIALTICLWSVFRTAYYIGFIGAIKMMASEISLLFYAPIGVLSIVSIIEKRQFCRQDIWRMVIIVGLFQAYISIFSYICKPFQELMCLFLMNVMSAEDIAWWSNYRLYGLSLSLSYGMPIAQALIGGLCLLYAERYNAKYWSLAPVIWLSGFINARVSIIVVAIELLLWAYFEMKKGGGKIKKCIAIFFCGGIMTFCFIIVLSFTGIIHISRRILDPLIEIVGYLSGNYIPQTHGYIQYFLSDPNALLMPKGLAFVFGGGIINNKSDVGYIIHLWLGGLLFSLFLYGFYFMLLKKWISRNKSDKYLRLIVIISGITLFVINVKGEAFLFESEFLNLFFLGIGISSLYDIKCSENVG